MTVAGDSPAPLRVAIVGAGPAGFFLAERLLGQNEIAVEVDLFERLPAPYGLVRFGVAPDHENIKAVTRAFDKTASRAGFRFFGNVEIGRHISLDDLTRHYHQVCFTTGAQTDRRMGITGEDLAGSHPATDFVAWYNGHPDYVDRRFDLSVERAAVVGVGNVAVDVARMLCRTPEELAATDVADYALQALRASRIREVYMLGRRGPAQAAFTNPEVKELGEMPGAEVRTLDEEVKLDPLSAEDIERENDQATRRKLEILRGFARRPRSEKPRLLTIRFLVSPVAVVGNPDGRVAALRLVRNRLVRGPDGSLRAEATDCVEELPVGLVFRSVGYRGVPLPGLPFDERAGVVPNDKGRVIRPDTRAPLPGLYVAGWIKRGPTGVIGTNKPDAAETAASMLEDAPAGGTFSPSWPDAGAAEGMVRSRRPEAVSFSAWSRLDRLETERGRGQGRPRVKFTSLAEMLDALGR
jgi:ferredoxin--NADP+ reductase